jgi:hypothetical protein
MLRVFPLQGKCHIFKEELYRFGKRVELGFRSLLSPRGAAYTKPLSSLAPESVQ